MIDLPRFDESQVARRFPIGVIIPTFNRASILLSCLQHLERQSWSEFDVIIVDDGSTDCTGKMLDEYQRDTPLHLRVLSQRNRGPARARNLAISELQSPICLMIGDDILAPPDLVVRHLELHQKRSGELVAGLGMTVWSEVGQTVTPFMRWLEDSGSLFAYGDLLSGSPPNWKHFYTNNLSVATALLRENPFNEEFTKAAAEDTELGFRLVHKHALEIVFIPEAIAFHVHPTDFRRECRRRRNIGCSMRTFHELVREPAPQSTSRPLGERIRHFVLNSAWIAVPLSLPWLLSFLTFLGELATLIICPNQLMRLVFSCHYLLGYHGRASLVKTPRG